MISISSISASLSTDSVVSRRRPPPATLCRVIPLNTAALVGVAMTSLLVLSLAIYCIVMIAQHPEGKIDKGRAIGLVVVGASFVLVFSSLFAAAVWTERARLMLPFVALSTFLLFALVAICIFCFVTAADEMTSEATRAESTVLC